MRDGALLELTLTINHVTTDSCEPFLGVLVDIWHCDADGVYSDFAAENSAGQKFLRGYQVTDAHGIAKFTTTYPGWYPGRAVHIHINLVYNLMVNVTVLMAVATARHVMLALRPENRDWDDLAEIADGPS